MNHNRSLYEYKYLSHAKRRASVFIQLRHPCSFAFTKYIFANIYIIFFLIPFGIRKTLHIKCGKSEFLHIFTGLFKSRNVMVCILPRLLKNRQILKLSYCTFKNKQQSILQPSLGKVPLWRAAAKRDLRLSEYGAEVFPLTVEFEGHLHSGVPFPAVNVVKPGQLEWIMMISCHLTKTIGSCIIKKCVKLERGTSENFQS